MMGEKIMKNVFFIIVFINLIFLASGNILSAFAIEENNLLFNKLENTNISDLDLGLLRLQIWLRGRNRTRIDPIKIKIKNKTIEYRRWSSLNYSPFGPTIRIHNSSVFIEKENYSVNEISKICEIELNNILITFGIVNYDGERNEMSHITELFVPMCKSLRGGGVRLKLSSELKHINESLIVNSSIGWKETTATCNYNYKKNTKTTTVFESEKVTKRKLKLKIY